MRFKTNTCSIFIILSIIALGSKASAGSPALIGVDNQSDPASIRILIKMTGSCEYNAFVLSDPARLVVDFQNATSELVPFKKEFKDPVLHAVRIGKPTPETIRVVLDLSFLIPYKITTADNGYDVLLTLTRKVETLSSTMEVLSGITYTAKTEMTDKGPLAIHILDVNMNNPDISLHVGIGEDKLGGREKLSSLVKRKGAAIGVNGGYFSMNSGMPIDLLIVKGKVLLLPDRYRGFFGIDSEGMPVFMRPNTEIGIKIADRYLQYVHRLNWPPKAGDLAIFTPEYGKTTGTGPERSEIIISKNKVKAFSNGNSTIPDNGIVLSGDYKHKDFIDSIKIGDTAMATISSYPDIKNIVYGFSAGPVLVKEGVLQNKLVEDFTISSGIIAKINPRTAAGRTNNNHLILVVVEGRNTRSIGMSLAELGKLMLSLGAVNAINLDGGGSSELVIGDKIINQLPSNQERPIANAILLFHK